MSNKKKSHNQKIFMRTSVFENKNLFGKKQEVKVFKDYKRLLLLY